MCFSKYEYLLYFYNFIAYEDVDDDIKLSANHMSYCLDDLTLNVPLCVPDPVDPTKIPCYNKAQVSKNILHFFIIFYQVLTVSCIKQVRQNIPIVDAQFTLLLLDLRN